jgi:hypothetical protein
MPPAMLTLVAAVLAYDFARDSSEARSLGLASLSLYVMFETSVENDIVAEWRDAAEGR